MPTQRKGGYKPQSQRNRTIGTVKAGRTSSGGFFNNLPAIIRAFPEACADIVEESTYELAEFASQQAPRGATGELKVEVDTTVKTTRTGAVRGKVEFSATSEIAGVDKWRYAWFVEVGTEDTAAQPFLVPAIMEERLAFHERLRKLEDRLPR